MLMMAAFQTLNCLLRDFLFDLPIPVYCQYCSVHVGLLHFLLFRLTCLVSCFAPIAVLLFT